MMRNVACKNMQFVIKVCLAACLSKDKSKKNNSMKDLDIMEDAFFLKAQCTTDSCENGKCLETINKTTCACDPGFKGDRCETGKKKKLCCRSCLFRSGSLHFFLVTSVLTSSCWMVQTFLMLFKLVFGSIKLFTMWFAFTHVLSYDTY